MQVDITRFNESSPGKLVKIDFPVEDHAFIPCSLRELEWKFPEDLWPILGDAKQRLGELNGIGRMLPNPQILMQPLSKREALRSSSLEGTYATPQELLLFELSQKPSSFDNSRANEWREVYNYDAALKLGHMIFKDQDLDLVSIRQLHSALLRGVRGTEKDPGKFRDCQIHIGSDRRFIPPPPLEVTSCLDAFIDYVRAPSANYDPLVNAFIVHYQFECIHPFKDGNGRIGRVLLALTICKWCNHHLPWLYMSPYFERYKDEYFDGLFDISAKGNWHKWIEFCLRGTVEQAKDSIRRCEALVDTQKKFHLMVDIAAPRLHPIIDLLFDSPIIDVSSITSKCKVSYPTAKSDIDKLIEVGILSEIRTLRPKSFYSPEIMRIAYNET